MWKNENSVWYNVGVRLLKNLNVYPMEKTEEAGAPEIPAVEEVAAVPTLEERLVRFNEGMRALSVETGLTVGAQPYMDGDAVRMRIVAVEMPTAENVAE